MRGRDRPISYEKARTLLFERLAKNIGITVEFTSQDWHDGPIGRTSDIPAGEMGGLWTKAGRVLDQLIFAGTVPFWIEDDHRWTRATHDILVARLMTGEEPNGLFVDRDEFEAAAANAFPADFGRIRPAEVPTRPEVASVQPPNVRRRGRQPGSGGYASDDAPLLLEMAKLMRADPSLSVSAASLMVVDRAKGTRNAANRAKRLERKFTQLREKGR